MQRIIMQMNNLTLDAVADEGESEICFAKIC